jgi:hypothetical protein
MPPLNNCWINMNTIINWWWMDENMCLIYVKVSLFLTGLEAKKKNTHTALERHKENFIFTLQTYFVPARHNSFSFIYIFLYFFYIFSCLLNFPHFMTGHEQMLCKRN